MKQGVDFMICLTTQGSNIVSESEEEEKEEAVIAKTMNVLIRGVEPVGRSGVGVGVVLVRVPRFSGPYMDLGEEKRRVHGYLVYDGWKAGWQRCWSGLAGL